MRGSGTKDTEDVGLCNPPELALQIQLFGDQPAQRVNGLGDLIRNLRAPRQHLLHIRYGVLRLIKRYILSDITMAKSRVSAGSAHTTCYDMSNPSRIYSSGLWTGVRR